MPIRLVFLVLLTVLCPRPGLAFTVATDASTGDELRWDTSDPLEYRLQQDFGGGLVPLRVQGMVRQSFETWTSLADSDVELKEGRIFRGQACPHAIPPDMVQFADAICGGPLTDADGESAIFFIETVWPFDTAVIALTTLTWAEGGKIVDADIALNGLDYTWTTGDSDAQTDFQSILTHEIGHFLGLAHSDVPGAVMGVDYSQGDVVRTLTQDDVDGLAYLYPCSGGRCSSDVGFPSPSGCSLGGGAGVLGALLGILGLAGALRRRRGATLPLLLAVLLLPARGESTVVEQLDASDLSARSDAVVRATVTSMESSLHRVVWTDVDLRVDEVLQGEAPDEITLSQPGGHAGGYGTLVFGMPDFTVGEEVVLFLDFTAYGPRVVGLAQGKATVGPDGALSRDLSGLALARAAGAGPVRTAALPSGLGELRARLR